MKPLSTGRSVYGRIGESPCLAASSSDTQEGMFDICLLVDGETIREFAFTLEELQELEAVYFEARHMYQLRN